MRGRDEAGQREHGQHGEPGPGGRAGGDRPRNGQRAARAGHFPGYSGPADQKAAEVLSKYIIIDMYAKAVQGMAAEDAVKWAASEVKKIHA